MHYLKQILHLLHNNYLSGKSATHLPVSFQRVTLESRKKESMDPSSQATQMTEDGSISIDYNLADNVYEICKQHGNNVFLVADENTAKLLNKNVLSKISHLIIPGGSIASLDIVNFVRNKARGLF